MHRGSDFTSAQGFEPHFQVKRTTRLLLRSFLGPFVVTFLVALFFLDMQFLWVYADELIGKGLAVHVVLELLLYASARLVNLALPLSLIHI